MCTDMDEIKLSTVKISKKGIYAIEDKRDLIFVPHERISSVKLLYGCGVQRPKIQAVLVIAFILIPLYFCLPPFLERLSGTNSNSYVSQIKSNYNNNDVGGAGRDGLLILALPLIFIVIGIFFLIEMIKKNFYLIVRTKTENKKIIFRGKVSHSELYQFIEQANNDFGYSITSELKNHT